MPSDSTIELYKQLAIKLLPKGRLWQVLSARFQLFFEAFCIEMARQRESYDALTLESNPATATVAGLLSEQESSALLPDEMPSPGESEQQRQQAVAAKKQLKLPGPTRNFFADLASAFGMTISITEGTRLYFTAGCRAGDRLILEQGKAVWTITILTDPDSNTAKFQQRAQRLAPAHTKLIFA